MAIRQIDQTIHKAAWLYYTHGLRQDEVARQLNISRASVAMYLRKARETGIVNISTSTRMFTDDALAREVEDAYGLASVWVVPHDGHGLDPTAEVPVVGASVFLDLARNGDRNTLMYSGGLGVRNDRFFADLAGVFYTTKTSYTPYYLNNSSDYASAALTNKTANFTLSVGAFF